VSFLQGLHGAVALALLPGLLFAEEAGMPLPFAPGELTLLVAGLLIVSGGLNPYVFIPLALVACIAGSLVGYSWRGWWGTGDFVPWPSACDSCAISRELKDGSYPRGGWGLRSVA
jgi:membrane protein DedA with SNARE-associated domain